MKKSTKIVVFIWVAVALALMISGCMGSDTPTESPPAARPSPAIRSDPPAVPDTTASPTPPADEPIDPPLVSPADPPEDISAGDAVNPDGIPRSDYTGAFDMSGMWETAGGNILTFHPNGSVGPLLFGFDGGPDGSWMISSRADDYGHYTLQASHITGGSPVYTVRLISEDEIELHADSGVNFGASYYKLTRR